MSFKFCFVCKKITHRSKGEHGTTEFHAVPLKKMHQTIVDFLQSIKIQYRVTRSLPIMCRCQKILHSKDKNDKQVFGKKTVQKLQKKIL